MTDRRQLTIYAKLLLRDGPPDGFLRSNRSIVDAVHGCTRQTKGHKLDDTPIPYHSRQRIFLSVSKRLLPPDQSVRASHASGAGAMHALPNPHSSLAARFADRL
jgi:hypothetical protein